MVWNSGPGPSTRQLGREPHLGAQLLGPGSQQDLQLVLVDGGGPARAGDASPLVLTLALLLGRGVLRVGQRLGPGRHPPVVAVAGEAGRADGRLQADLAVDRDGPGGDPAQPRVDQQPRVPLHDQARHPVPGQEHGAGQPGQRTPHHQHRGSFLRHRSSSPASFRGAYGRASDPASATASHKRPVMPDSGTAASAMVVAWSTAAAKAAAAMAGRHRVGPGRTDLRARLVAGAVLRLWGDRPDVRLPVGAAGLPRLGGRGRAARGGVRLAAVTGRAAPGPDPGLGVVWPLVGVALTLKQDQHGPPLLVGFAAGTPRPPHRGRPLGAPAVSHQAQSRRDRGTTALILGFSGFVLRRVIGRVRRSLRAGAGGGMVLP